MGRGALNRTLLALLLALAAAASLPAADPRDEEAQRHLKQAEEAVWQQVFGQRVVAEARKQLGQPYVWGDKTGRRGFDCSGYTAFVFNSLGVDLAVSALLQYQQGFALVKENLIPGDLVFFSGRGAPLHVGIYEGDGHFLHAPGTGRVIESGSMDNPYFSKRYVGARRLTPTLDDERRRRGEEEKQAQKSADTHRTKEKKP